MTTATTPTPKRNEARTPLTHAERAVLTRLKGLKDARRLADHAHDKKLQDPRGTFQEQGTCVVYSKDGFSSDIRARRAVVRVARRIEAMGHEIEGFGIGGEGGTWVLVVRFEFGTGKRRRECLEWEFSTVVSEVWTEVGGYEPGFAEGSWWVRVFAENLASLLMQIVW